MDEQITIERFILRHGLVMAFEQVDENPNMPAFETWGATASHYEVTISRLGPALWPHEIAAGKTRDAGIPYTTFFSMGSAYRGDPELPDVLDCLANDASMFDCARDIDDFAADLGYSKPSEAQRVYKACKRTSKGLTRLLGLELYSDLLYHTERL